MSKEDQFDPNNEGQEEVHDITPVSGMYKDWFLDYASYVILERAVPNINDGLKPVQRRLLHAMRTMHDGRFHKVANIIGNTMQYHPHGDAAIGDALVNLGQKELLIETQGNWGDIRTGDSAAAPRYIEARLSKFALDVVFNPDTTEWQLSYDGRNKEPVTLPVKFPLVLSQGVEGIAVGLATKIMPHNFCEIIEASIDILKGKSTELFPDFPTGGLVDVTQYKSGKRGSRLRVRTRVEEVDKKTLVIRDIPYGVTTGSLIDSIVKANEQGKIKIKRVIDNTARDVEIFIELPKGSDPDITIDALYAFTDCEVSIAPNCCVLMDEKPHFLGVEEIIEISTGRTKYLLKRELEIRKGELEEKWHFSSLEKIFIEKRIYRDIEECETWPAVIETIDTGLEPYKKLFRREIKEDDIVRLTEIKIKRISKYDSFRADEEIKSIEEELEDVKYDLAHLTDYAINYFERLLKQYGKGRERKTEIKVFEEINAQEVAAATLKLYVNRKEGFVGTGLKKEEYIGECSDVDDIIAFTEEGKYKVFKVSDKTFIGKNIIHVAVWKKGDERTIYNAMYIDGKSAVTRAKRFAVKSITREREYDVTKGTPNSRVLYFSANPNSESEIVTVYLSPASNARKKVFDYDFAEIDIKGRASQGNIVSKYSVKRVKFKEKGDATLGGIDIWYLDTLGRLNTEERGTHLGSFEGDDQIIAFYKDGTYELTNYELTNRYDAEKLVKIEKFDEQAIYSAIYYDSEQKVSYAKRFQIETSTRDKKFLFISEAKRSELFYVSSEIPSVAEITYKDGRKNKSQRVVLDEAVEVRGWKAVGNKLVDSKLMGATVLEPTEKELEKFGQESNNADSKDIQEPEESGGKDLFSS